MTVAQRRRAAGRTDAKADAETVPSLEKGSDAPTGAVARNEETEGATGALEGAEPPPFLEKPGAGKENGDKA
ncbi:hypothetical protein [Rhizobium halophytocola]|uniref:Uncharacterized protein n=1 Tax=Rhizobium halophytocola TaxID=735519 RepID=A0ABS4DVD7_9HYPH|nr:hypothetical protein [Rhizobium halophytocola]MBP1849651.1 hypothetical protein [Rhizobium halophytocola]